MLSRVADSLYWMSRYLERAEHTARLLDLNLHGMLDQKSDVALRRWQRVQQSLGLNPSEPPEEPQAIAYRFAFDQGLNGSIVRCIAAARHNAREVREELSTEMWEQLNRLFLHVRRVNRSEVREGQVHDFFQAIKEGAHLFQGITDSTISHDDGWLFIQMGRYLERVIATVNLLDAHFAEYHPTGEVPEDRYIEWAGLLKSCSALEAYACVYTANVQPEKAAGFLLLSPNFPRSVRFGVGEVRRALALLSEHIPALKHSNIHRLMGKLFSSLSFDAIEEIIAGDVHAYLGDIRAQCINIHDNIYDTCVTYPIEFALTA
jgi:uncharacterized alpha-E superfamily protein